MNIPVPHGLTDYVHVLPDEHSYQELGRLDASGQRRLCQSGEHIVIEDRESRKRLRRSAHREPRYRVARVSMGSLNSGSSMVVAEELTLDMAVVLARGLNERARIVPIPDHPIGVLVHEQELLESRRLALAQERQSALARFAEEQDAIEARIEELEGLIEQAHQD